MVYCSKCGTQLPESSFFCPKCGVRTEAGIAAGATIPMVEEVREAFIKAGKEMEKAFNTAAKEMEDVYRKARDNYRESRAKSSPVCAKCGNKDIGNAAYCPKCGNKM